ncbi:MAG: hypothetical protein ABII21_03940 [bacterium]
MSGSELVKLAVRTVEKLIGKSIPNKLKIKAETTLPIGSGLGSSASLSAGVIGGVAEYLKLGWNKQKINEVTYLVEKITHGNPSGVDNTAVVYGGLLRFERGMNGEQNKLENLEVRKILQKMWLIDSGKPEETTGEMVSLIKERYLSDSKLENYFRKIGEISNQLQVEIENDRFSPEWIMENERLLEKIGVVGDKAKGIISKIEKMGGYAKICGAGGIDKGSGVMLVYHPDDEKFESWVKKGGYIYFQDHLGGPGWRIEK